MKTPSKNAANEEASIENNIVNESNPVETEKEDVDMINEAEPMTNHAAVEEASSLVEEYHDNVASTANSAVNTVADLLTSEPAEYNDAALAPVESDLQTTKMQEEEEEEREHIEEMEEGQSLESVVDAAANIEDEKVSLDNLQIISGSELKEEEVRFIFWTSITFPTFH